MNNPTAEITEMSALITDLERQADALQILKANPHPTLEEVKEGLSGNLCLCTGYQKIFDAVMNTYAEPAE